MERTLGTFTPAGLDPRGRDRFLLRLGARSADRQLLAWRCVAAVLLLGLSGVLVIRTGSAPKDNAGTYAHLQSAPPVQSIEAADASREAPLALAYLDLRTRVLEEGVDAIPASPSNADVQVRSIWSDVTNSP